MSHSDLLTGRHIPFVTTYRCFHSGFTCQRGDRSCCCSWKKPQKPSDRRAADKPCRLYVSNYIDYACPFVLSSVFNTLTAPERRKRCAEARSQGTREALVTPIKAKEVSKWVKNQCFLKGLASFFYTFDEVPESWTLLLLLWGAISSVCGKCNGWCMYDWSDGWLHLDHPTVLGEVILPRRWSSKVRCVNAFVKIYLTATASWNTSARERDRCANESSLVFGSFTYTVVCKARLLRITLVNDVWN